VAYRVGAPGIRALYDDGAEGGDRMLGLSDVKIYCVAVPPHSVDMSSRGAPVDARARHAEIRRQCDIKHHSRCRRW
jgi:hypothetical protein